MHAEGSETGKNGAFEKMSGCQGSWHTHNKGSDSRMRTDLMGGSVSHTEGFGFYLKSSEKSVVVLNRLDCTLKR